MAYTNDLPARPMPSGQHAKRMTESGLRRRMLYGEWTADLDYYIRDNIGTVRQSAWGHGDISRCAWLDIAKAQSTLYDRKPELSHENPAALAELERLLESAGWASMMPRIQRDTIAIREMHLHPVIQPTGEMTLIPAFPSDVEGEGLPDDPERLGYAKWHRVRVIGGRRQWTVDCWDVRNPEQPTFVVLDASGRDITRAVMLDVPDDGYLGDSYPWRYQDARPFVPLATYHAARTGQLYDWSSGCEITEATMRIGLYYSYFGHTMRNAAWSQRYSVGVDWAGSGTSHHRDGRQEVVADPATVLQGVQDHDQTASPVIGAWSPPITPDAMLGAVESYTRTVYATAGLSAADVSRVSGDPRSGYALAVTRDGQREMARKFEPMFRRGDLELFAMVSAMVGLPNVGWSIYYTAMPPTIDELMKIQSFVGAELATGRMSRVDAFRALHPGLDDVGAMAQLAAIDALNEGTTNDRRNDE